MKKYILILMILFGNLPLYAKWNTSGNNTIHTNSGNVGIGTSNPVSKFQVYGGNATLWGITLGQGTGNANITTDDNSKPITFQIAGAEAMRIHNSGNIAIGTQTPYTKLHIVNSGSNLNSVAQYSGDLIIQGNTGGRSQVNGASIEFVIPANTDGNNPWGQARIISVAGNGDSYNPTGKLIFGTRRNFDKKTGTGLTWNYGDDLVIDGAGNVGIGTSSPDEKLAVNGTIHSKEVKVDMNGWADHVFKPSYKLPSLNDVRNYIDQNKHLPDMPSEQEVAANGINLGEMNKLLLKKVEELTLYLIENEKRTIHQQHQINILKKIK